MSWLRSVVSSLNSPHTRQIATLGVYVSFPLVGLYILKSDSLLADHSIFSPSFELTGEFMKEPQMEGRVFLKNWNAVYQDNANNLEKYNQSQLQYLQTRIDQGIFDQDVLDSWKQKYKILEKKNFLNKKAIKFMNKSAPKRKMSTQEEEKLKKKVEDVLLTFQLKCKELDMEMEVLSEKELLRRSNKELNKAQDIILNALTNQDLMCDKNSEYLRFTDEFKEECKQITQSIDGADEKDMFQLRNDMVNKMKSKFLDIIKTNISINTQKMNLALLQEHNEESNEFDQKIETKQIQPATEIITAMADFFFETKAEARN